MMMTAKDEIQAFKSGLLEAIPPLRAFARMLARDPALADDLVQDTLEIALVKRHQFQPGTKLQSWLIMILRNRFFNEVRRTYRKMEVGVDFLPDLYGADGGSEVGLEIRDFRKAFAKLPREQREALILIVTQGYSYEEAADIAGCPMGTLKSRVPRARSTLEQAMRGEIRQESGLPLDHEIKRPAFSGTL